MPNFSQTNGKQLSETMVFSEFRRKPDAGSGAPSGKTTSTAPIAMMAFCLPRAKIVPVVPIR